MRGSLTLDSEFESHLFHPDERYGERSPETVDHLQHFSRGSKEYLGKIAFLSWEKFGITSLLSNFGLMSQCTATLWTNFPIDESVSKPFFVATSLTQSLDMSNLKEKVDAF